MTTYLRSLISVMGVMIHLSFVMYFDILQKMGSMKTRYSKSIYGSFVWE